MNENLSVASAVSLSRHEFDTLRSPARSRIAIRRCRPEDIRTAIELAYASITGPMATAEVAERVRVKNANNLLMFWRGDQIVGTWSMLMLSMRGLESLLVDEFNPLDPELSFLTPPAETPAGIYVWAVVAPGLAAEGVRHVSQFLRQPLYAAANLYARPATREGAQLSDSLGFRPFVHKGTAEGGQLYRYTRLPNRHCALSMAA